MANSNSRKHARKVTLDAAVNNAIEKAVDARKVAAFTVGAAGVIAGAAFAFGATPAMAAEAGAATPSTDAAQTPVTAGDKAGAAAENAGEKADADKKNEADKADKKNQTDVNKEDGEQSDNKEDNKSENTENTDDTKDKSTVVKKRSRRDLSGENQKQETANAVQDRATNSEENQDTNKIKPAAQTDGSTKIEINENNAGTVPNVYGWGSSDNTYSVDGEKHTITFHFAAPKDGGKITNIAILPSITNGLDNATGRKSAEYYSGNDSMHQSYSGNYTFNKNEDGSATLTMSTLFRDGNLNGGAEKYAANRSIFVYVTKDNSETIAYKTNAFRAATLVPPKTSGSVVLKYNQPLTAEQVQAAITAAANAATTRSDKMSVNGQIVAASKAYKVFTIVDGKSTQVADTLDGKLNVKSSDAYDKTTFDAINAKKAGDDKTYVVGAKILTPIWLRIWATSPMLFRLQSRAMMIELISRLWTIQTTFRKM